MKPAPVSLTDRARAFARELDEARKIAKGPDIFRERAAPESGGSPGELRVLRRWNSHTPSIWDVLGGGYFMRWKRRGTVIDPGCSFIRLLRLLTLYGLGDMDMVIATHDHVDHCQDFGTLISLCRQYNTWLLERGQDIHTYDFVVSHGVANKFAPLLNHTENAPFLRWRTVLPPRDVAEFAAASDAIKEKIGQEKADPCSRNDGAPKAEDKGLAYFLARYEFWAEEIKTKYNYALRAIPAVHTELLGEHTSMGLRFELNDSPNECVVVISGDTAIGPANNAAVSIPHQYEDADLLVLHVGTMEKVGESGLERLSDHLGLAGVRDILGALAQKNQTEKLKLVVLTEWGYEFGRLGLKGRTRFTKLVEQELEEGGCRAFFAAVPRDGPEDEPQKGQIPIIPADVNLRISLPEVQVWADDKDKGNGFVPAFEVEAQERAEAIEFRRRR